MFFQRILIVFRHNFPVRETKKNSHTVNLVAHVFHYICDALLVRMCVARLGKNVTISGSGKASRKAILNVFAHFYTFFVKVMLF